MSTLQGIAARAQPGGDGWVATRDLHLAWTCGRTAALTAAPLLPLPRQPPPAVPSRSSC